MPLTLLAKLNFKQKMIINIIFFLIIVISVFYFVIMPTIKNIKTISGEIKTQKVDLEEKYLKGQNLKKLNESLRKIEPQINILDQIFISQNRELEFITTIEEVAHNNNVIQKINLNEIQDNNSTYKETTLQLAIQGTFNNQLSYLKDLESLNYYINIESIKLFPGSSQLIKQDEELKQTKQDINMTIQGLTFWK